MLFMVIERFRDNDMVPVYQRVQERGRMLPDGLRHIDSWVEPSFSRCFQLMECDDPQLLLQWTNHWQDLVDFEIVPVVTSKDAAEAIAVQTWRRGGP